MKVSDFRKIAMKYHSDVNHYYDGYNYILHLDAVEAVHQEFKEEFDVELSFTPDVELRDYSILGDMIISEACYYHDLIEDTRLTYNNLKEFISSNISLEIVYALTNDKGRTREERAGAGYYLNIRQTPGASFVKMCDRIANVRYSRLMGSVMFAKYKSENEKFMKGVDADRFPRMKECLIKLFE